MYCQKCGRENNINARSCVNCGNPFPHTYPSSSVPNYLVPAILVTVLCCVPFGIVAIVYASQVDTKLIAGDYYGAVGSSNKAKMWCWVSFICAAAVILLFIIIAVVAIALS